MSIRRIIKITAPVLLFSSAVSAGGMEKIALSTSFMYQDGNYAEVGFQSRDYEVNSATVNQNSVVGDFTSTSIAVKLDVTDSLSFGLSRYRQSSISVDYPSAWSSPSLPAASLDVDATAVLAKYNFSDEISVLGGVKISTVQDASLSINALGINSAISGDTQTSYVYGVAYERPEIAMRVELVREENVAFTLDTVSSGAQAITTTTASLPNFTSANFQTGIAENTLMFGSIRYADWGSNQVNMIGALPSPTISSFSDSTSYSIGIGRRVSERLSGSLSYNWENGAGPSSTSLLSMTNGYKGISAGLKYEFDNLTISGGVNYTKLGDVDVTTPSPATYAFKDNNVTTLGVSIGYHF